MSEKLFTDGQPKTIVRPLTTNENKTNLLYIPVETDTDQNGQNTVDGLLADFLITHSRWVGNGHPLQWLQGNGGARPHRLLDIVGQLEQEGPERAELATDRLQVAATLEQIAQSTRARLTHPPQVREHVLLDLRQDLVQVSVDHLLVVARDQTIPDGAHRLLDLRARIELVAEQLGNDLCDVGKNFNETWKLVFFSRR